MLPGNGYDVYATNDDAVTKLTVDGNIKGKGYR